MFRFAIPTALILTAAGLFAAAPVPPPQPPDNGPSADALREAIAVLDKSEENTIDRTRLWCAAADLHRRLDDPKGAAAALRKARQVAEALPHEPFSEWRQIGQVYGRLGDATDVTDLAAATPVKVENRLDNPRATILQESALAAAEAGHIREAEQIAEALENADTKKWVAASIRRSALIQQAKAGDAAGAIRAAGQLATSEEQVQALVGRGMHGLAWDDFRVGEEGGIAAVQLAADDKRAAKETALKALALLPDVDPKRRASAAVDVVRILARMDDLASARKALAQISGADPKVVGQGKDRPRSSAEMMAQGLIAAAEVRAGRDEAATAIAQDFPLPGAQAYILQFVALAQARAGRMDAAKTNFSQAVELVGKGQGGTGTTLHNIASAQALAGDFVGAAKTAESESGSITWANVADYLAQAGDYAGARRMASDRIKKDGRWWYAMLCKGIAMRQAKAGQVAAVKEWAEKEDDQLVKAHILVGLAEGLYREGGKVRTPR